MKQSLLIITIFIFSVCYAFSQLIWSTYLGGSNSDNAQGIKVDSIGNTLITGCTLSSEFPISTGAYQNYQKGDFDVFVTKLNSTGSNIIFSTFIGGQGYDLVFDIMVDKSCSSYITGTGSYNYPTTPGVFKTNNNFTYMIFVTKLNSLGTALLYSTFIDPGYYGLFYRQGIAIDTLGDSYIVGSANSQSYPTTAGAYDTIFNGLNGDAVLTKLNTSGCSLIFSTFIGGNTEDQGLDIAIDIIGNSFITGITNSKNFPITTGVYQSIYQGGYDAYITKLNPAGSSLIFSAFIGKEGSDLAITNTIDKEGNSYISGYTYSYNFPTSFGCYDSSFNGNVDIFITKLNSFASSLIYSTFIGGSDKESPWNLALDNSNNAYITGYTCSNNYPVTKSCFDTIFNNGWSDVILTKIKADGSKLIYSSYIGGNSNSADAGNDIFIDSLNNIFLAGLTRSNEFPVTQKSYDTSFNGSADAFVSKLNICKVESNIQVLDSLLFPRLLCESNIKDTIIMLCNIGTCPLILTGAKLTGLDLSQFSIYEPKNIPVYIQPIDSLKIVIRFTPNEITGKKKAALILENNSFNNPYIIIQLSANNDKISSNINNSESDTIFIDLGTYCPGDSIKDTTITIFNKSSVGTTFKIENVDPNLQIIPEGKAGKGNRDVPQAVKPKKKKKTPNPL